MIKLIAIGHLGKDASVRENNGRIYINFSVAENRKFKNAEGVEVEKTIWLNCSISREKNQSIEISKYLTKGTQVYIEGNPDPQLYNTNEGKPAIDFKVIVSNVQLLGSKPAGTDTPAAAGTGAAQQPAETSAGDDLPY